MRQITKIRFVVAFVGFTFVSACGKKTKGDETEEAHAGVPSEVVAQQAAATASPFVCLQKKTPAEFVTTLVQDAFRRGPTPEELKRASDPAFDYKKTVEWAVAQPELLNGVAYFVSNLLRIEQNLKATPNNAIDAALVADLKQEPVVLVQRSMDKPWPELFTTRKIYCTSRTAPLYRYPVDTSISGFVDCEMEQERSGILGLVSVLRGFTSAFYLVNNNYHRVNIATYLAQGLQLAAKTDGPTGEGRPIPMDACVPQSDNRVAAGGLVFGAAAVPKSGAVCAGCHAIYQGPMSGAFMQFGEQGQILDLANIDQLNNNIITDNGATRDQLKDILKGGTKSCFRVNGPNTPPRDYIGLPGLGRIISESTVLGRALAIQIQQNLMNRNPDETATIETVAGYESGGKTLKAALTGYFASNVYQCGIRGE